MLRIPFTKLHGAENDFLLTWGDDAPSDNLPSTARRICDRITGVGADGWMLVWRADKGLRTRLFNSDGSEPEISGNGTRCAAAFALLNQVAHPPVVQIITAAGAKNLRVLSHAEERFQFEMDMGQPKLGELHASLHLQNRDFDATLLNVGNPQCAIFVENFPKDWRAIAAEAEALPRFPNRSNVSLVRRLDQHTIETLFYERGAGETRSSGTGSTGAGAAAILRGEVESPLEIRTPAGSLQFRWDESVYLTGPAELVAEGIFHLGS